MLVSRENKKSNRRPGTTADVENGLGMKEWY